MLFFLLIADSTILLLPRTLARIPPPLGLESVGMQRGWEFALLRLLTLGVARGLPWMIVLYQSGRFRLTGANDRVGTPTS